ncbi:hypothetical protein Csa_000130 [Cucumis sativus]|nr:hypothetical protein Csa_000130 [Cucumis sativus]
MWIQIMNKFSSISRHRFSMSGHYRSLQENVKLAMHLHSSKLCLAAYFGDM